MCRSSHDFWHTPLHEVYNAINGYIATEDQKWRRLRRMTYLQMATMTDVSKFPEKWIYPMHGDEDNTRVTVADRDAVAERTRIRDAEFMRQKQLGLR